MSATLTSADRAELVRAHERQANGAESFIRHWLGMIYTGGMEYVAETCGAYWLLDAVASWQPKIRRKGPALAEFQVWRLRRRRAGRNAGEWVLDAWTDTPGEPGSVRLAVQVIPYSDFPEELAPFEFYVENGTALLKGER